MHAAVRDGDIVTVGNTDLTVAGGTLVARPAGHPTGGVEAQRLGLTVDGRPLLAEVSFAARPGTLTAVIGPSGAGKTTLIKLLGGAVQPSFGRVSFDGHDVHAEYASLRSRIGVVPQDDVVHRQLTVEQALGYAAELRLPPDTSAADRRAVVDQVIVFSGGMFPISGRFGLDQLSWYLPSRWGFAASASTVDLTAIDPIAPPDQLWTHSGRWWLADMVILALLGVVWIALVRWRLRLPGRG